MLQRAFLWLAVALMPAWAVYGVVREQLWTQTGWTAPGLWSLASYLGVFAALSAAVLVMRPQWYGAALAALGLLYSCSTVGPRAVLAVAFIALSAYATGRLIMPREQKPATVTHILTLATGLLVYMVWFLFTLGLPIHYWWIYAVLLSVPIYLNFHYGRFPILAAPRGPAERAWPLMLVWAPLLAQWMMALKPEAGDEALSRHLVFGARLAAEHAWHYDVRRVTWAVFPMGGDALFGLAQLLGGVAAARLFNFLLLALIVWLLYERLHRRVPSWIAAALAGGYAAAPITVMRSSSLAVENWIAFYALAAVLLLRLHTRRKSPVHGYLSALMAGAACSCGVSGFAFLLPFFVGYAALTSAAVWMPGAAAALGLALAPYLNALWHTANPFFPYYNNFFRSPFYDSLHALPLSAFHEPVSPRAFYDLTFRGDRYLAGLKPSFGFTLFFFLPIVVLAVKRHWPRTGFVLLGTSLFALVVTLAVAPELTHFYVILPLIVLLTGIAIGSHRLHSLALGRALGALAVVVYVLNWSCLPAAGRLQDDFVLLPFSPAARERYLAGHAPEQVLLARLDAGRQAPTVALLESGAAGAYSGRVYTNSWDTPGFAARLYQASSADSLAMLARELKLDYFITNTESPHYHQTIVPGREFLDRFARVTARFGHAELHRFTPPEPGQLPPEQSWARPGWHDDLDPAIHYDGYWAREVDAPAAYQGAYTHTNDLRSRLEIRLIGRAVRLVYTAAANRCLNTVSFGYNEPVNWDEYSTATRWQSVSPAFVAPAPGANTFVVHIATPDKSLGNLGACHLDLDGFIVE